MSDFSSDLELWRGLKAGQTNTLSEIYDRYGELMYGLALQMLGNRQEAEDLIQELFLGLWRNCTYNPERGSFKSFLVLLVRSRAIDRLRSRKSILRTLERTGRAQETTHPLLEQVASGEICQRVQAALAELPQNQRQALEMAYFSGFSQTEIAEKLSVPLGTVKSWFRLSFGKLRRSLDDLMH